MREATERSLYHAQYVALGLPGCIARQLANIGTVLELYSLFEVIFAYTLQIGGQSTAGCNDLLFWCNPRLPSPDALISFKSSREDSWSWVIQIRYD